MLQKLSDQLLMERIIDVSMKVASLMKVAKKMSLLSVFLLLHTKLSNNKISINVLLQSVEVEENFFSASVRLLIILFYYT